MGGSSYQFKSAMGGVCSAQQQRVVGQFLAAHLLEHLQQVGHVQPCPLLARHGARLAGNGIDFQSGMAYRSRQAALARVRSLTDRAKRLPPLSAFGRSSAVSSSERSALGAG